MGLPRATTVWALLLLAAPEAAGVTHSSHSSGGGAHGKGEKSSKTRSEKHKRPAVHGIRRTLTTTALDCDDMRVRGRTLSAVDSLRAQIPHPFTRHAAKRATRKPETQTVSLGPRRELMATAYSAYHDNFCRLTQNETLVRLVAEAISAGVRVSEAGIDVGPWVHKRWRETPDATLAELLAEPQLRALRALYFEHMGPMRPFAESVKAAKPVPESWLGDKCNANMPGSTIHQRYVRADWPARYRPKREIDAIFQGEGAERGREIYEALERDGVARIDHFPGIDMDAIAKVATNSLMKSRHSGDPGKRPHGLERKLAPLFNWRALRLAMDAYLGTADTPHACTFGWKASAIQPDRTDANFPVAAWHHDQAGRRLKIFLFLHDVDPLTGRATRVAPGTHNFHWFAQSRLHDTQYESSWVGTNHKVEALGGPRGGGFIFDSNALHRASGSGTDPRYVVIFELDRPGRSMLVAEGGLRNQTLGFGGTHFQAMCPSMYQASIGNKSAVPQCPAPVGRIIQNQDY